MKILAVDTTHGSCSVALADGEEIIAEVIDNEAGKQAERLVSIMESVLHDVGVGYEDLGALAVNIGPGSFTGVRIGLAAIKGVKLVHGLPLIVGDSFESVAIPFVEQDKNVFSVLDARRGQVFCQLLSHELDALSQPLALKSDEVSDVVGDESFILTGNGTNLVKEELAKARKNFVVGDTEALPTARNIALIAARKVKKGDRGESVVGPLYVRAPDYKKP